MDTCIEKNTLVKVKVLVKLLDSSKSKKVQVSGKDFNKNYMFFVIIEKIHLLKKPGYSASLVSYRKAGASGTFSAVFGEKLRCQT